MLPFTKRPGRDESEDEDVITKDDLITAETQAPVSTAGRGKLASINDEEMTTLMPTKTIGDAVASAVAARNSSPRPAAGAPPPSRSPSSRPGTVPPSPASRSGKFAAQEDEEEDGRTVVRGAPKIVKRGSATSPPNSARGAKMGGMPTMPTTISPAAVIKATLESARAGIKPRTDHLMAGPPQDLLEDLADLHPADVGAEHTAILKAPHTGAPPPMIQGVKALSTQAMQPQAMQPQALPHGTIPPGSSRPLTGPPPPLNSNQSGGYAAHAGGYAEQSGGYAAQYNGPVPSGSVSVPGVAMPQSMPAHFMVPHAPYSDGRVDPPGTAVTSRMKVGGRPATSWALALAAFGIFVGVGAAAVMNGNDSFKETSASFVDPSRAAGGPTARAATGAQPATNTTPTGVPVANDQPTTVGVPPVAVPGAAPAVAEAVAAPVVTTPAQPAAAAPPAPPPAGVLAAAPPALAPAAPKPAPVAAAAAPRPAAAAPAPRAPKPAPQAAAADDAPVAAAPTAKPGKSGKGAAKGGGEMDDETKKALDELQKAQLERSF
ncbi:MAG: Alginate regulatory protein AlgP [Myxococcaceae bacterium]|nr:Alginate regulatory protein AlgP [Myxococcaceae bacterium]